MQIYILGTFIEIPNATKIVFEKTTTLSLKRFIWDLAKEYDSAEDIVEEAREIYRNGAPPTTTKFEEQLSTAILMMLQDIIDGFNDGDEIKGDYRLYIQQRNQF